MLAITPTIVADLTGGPVLLTGRSEQGRGRGAHLRRARPRRRRDGHPRQDQRQPEGRGKIAHNKVMVIDGETVVTGSFNFSANAGCCDAENLLVIHRPELAAAYAENFARRQAVSVEYVKAEP